MSAVTQRRIAVTTPTGHVGSRVTRLLVQAGVRPVLLVRDPARLDPEVVARADVRTVDLDDVAAVVAATVGVETLFWVAPPIEDDPTQGYVRTAEHAVAAIETNGIRRVVFQSSIGAEARHGFGEIDGLGRAEELFEQTGVDLTILRCGYFFTNLLMDRSFLDSGELTTTLPTDLPMGWVDPRDIGDVAAARLLARDWSGRVVQAVHGPVDLSWSEVAQIVGAAVGRPLTARQITDDEVADGLRSVGMSEIQIESIVGMSRGLREGFETATPRDLVSTTPTTLGGWAYEQLRPPG